MDDDFYLIWGETVRRRSLGKGIALCFFSGLGSYMLTHWLVERFGIGHSSAVAAALAVSVLVILGSGVVVNRLWGTSRDIQEAVPSKDQLFSVLHEFGSGPEQELAQLFEDPKDIQDIARETGLGDRLREITQEIHETNAKG